MKLLLQHRILLGYIILIVVIGSMAAIMFHERNRVHDIEDEITEIREANQTINAAHRHITVLATLGESAITWDDEDYQKYQLRRKKVDSLLLFLQGNYAEYTPSAPIDTLRLVLENKEKHLFNTMQAFQWQDSLLQEQEPAIAEQTKNFRTVTRKKKGIAGFFGAKETIQLENQNIRYPKWELLSIIDPAFEVIIEALARDEEVHLNKFGRFSIKHKKGARFYNINTGQKETAPDKKLVQFTPHIGFRFTATPENPVTDEDPGNP